MNEIYTLSEDQKPTRVTQLELEEILTRFNSDEQTEEDEEKLVEYCICDITQGFSDVEFTEEDIKGRMQQLMIGQALRHLTEDEFLDVSIDEDGEAFYSLTEKGKEYVQENASSKFEKIN